jgi:hypothetical protein
MAAQSKVWVCVLLLAGFAGSNPVGSTGVCLLERVVLSVTGNCVGLNTRPEEFYRLWCV